MRDFLIRWCDAMPFTIIGICSVGILAFTIGAAGIILGSDALYFSAFIFAQAGTAVALILGFILDRKRRTGR